MGRKRVTAPCWSFIFFMFNFFFKNICPIQKISKIEACRPLGVTWACRPLDRRQALCVVFFSFRSLLFFFHLGPSRRDMGGRSPPSRRQGACRPLGGRPAVPCLYKRCSPPPLSFELKNQRKIQKKERRRKRRSPAELHTCDLQVYSIAIVE